MTLTEKLISFENMAFLIIKEDGIKVIFNLENNYYQWSEALHMTHSHTRVGLNKTLEPIASCFCTSLFLIIKCKHTLKFKMKSPILKLLSFKCLSKH